MRIAGRVGAITGAASGIGRALALALTREGMALALADRDERGLHETVLQVARAGGRASLHVVDVTDAAAVRRWAEETAAEHGGVHLLANNAGVSIFGTVEELTVDEIAWVMNVNFWGVVHGTQAFLPLLRAQSEACIVNVSSVFGLWGPPGQSAYAASKFAVRGFSESLRGELAGTNVRVLTLHPGGIRTSIARSSRVAAAADAALAAKMTRAFDERFLRTSPDAFARAAVKAIRRGEDRLVAGSDANRIDWITRLWPVRGARYLSARAAGRTRRH